MIKRIIDISEPAYLSLKNGQLVIKKAEEEVARLPIEDIGILILQHPAIIVSQALIIACQQHRVAVLFCDERHLPYSLLLPLAEGHSLHSKVLKQQIAVKPTRKKALWQQIVQHKIEQQALTLRALNKPHQRLIKMATYVKSDDKENHEAQAAKYYWTTLFGKAFRRDYNGDGINALLNYGYAIMRAMAARAIVCAGLHPTLGLKHCNQYNALCLADDLMEPFRPWVDDRVFRIQQQPFPPEITREHKQVLLSLLSESVQWQNQSLPLMVAMHRLTAQLKRAYQADKAGQARLDYPQWLRN